MNLLENERINQNKKENDRLEKNRMLKTKENCRIVENRKMKRMDWKTIEYNKLD